MVNKIIEEEINNFVKNRTFKLKESSFISINELFESNINEDDIQNPNNEDVLTLIKNNEWEEQDSQRFRESLMKSKHSQMLTNYSIGELSNMKLFKLKNFNIGFALKDYKGEQYSEIVAVHNNEPQIKNIGSSLMRSAVDNGGKYLDHFSSDKLDNLYGSMGFKEYHRDKYDSQYDPDGTFKNKYGELDVVYRKHS